MIAGCGFAADSAERDQNVYALGEGGSSMLQQLQCRDIEQQVGIARCGGGGGDHTPPTVPQALRVVAPTCSELTLSWTASSDPSGVQAYRILRDGDPTPIATVAATIACVGTACGHVDPIAAQNELHTYQVAAVDGSSYQNVSAPSAADGAKSAACTGEVGELMSTDRIETDATVRGVATLDGDTFSVGSLAAGTPDEKLFVSRSGATPWTFTSSSAGGGAGRAAGNGIAVTATAVYAVGSFAGAVGLDQTPLDNGDPNDWDLVILRIDTTTGAVTHVREHHSVDDCGTGVRAGADAANGVAVVGSSIFVTGTFVSAIDLGGGCGKPLQVGGAPPAAPPESPSMASIDNPNPLGFLAKYRGSDLGVYAAFQALRFGDAGTPSSSVVPRGVSAVGTSQVAIVGSFFGTASFDNYATWPAAAGPSDLFVASYAVGTPTLMWSHRYASSYQAPLGQDAKAIACTSAACFLVGAITTAVDFGGGARPVDAGPTAFAASLDNAGVHQWSKTYLSGAGATTGILQAVAADAATLTVGGTTDAPVDFGGGMLATAGPVVATLDAADGAHQWTRGSTAGGTGSVNGVARDATSAAGISVGGVFSSGLNFGDDGLTDEGGFVSTFK